MCNQYRYNTQKNGSLEQRMALYKEKQQIEQVQKIPPAMKLSQETVKSKKVKQ